MSLITTPNIADPDAFFAALTDCYRERSDEQNQAFNARLILLLANHIGDLTTLKAALSEAS